jgi:hypothetical protein
LWSITAVAILVDAPVLYNKFTARETDFLLPEELDAARVRAQPNGEPPPR